MIRISDTLISSVPIICGMGIGIITVDYCFLNTLLHMQAVV